MGTMRYEGVSFPGVKAFCYERGEERTFRIDRILEIATAPA
jgi:predicted DNA-binding transcriptional regulator YafY